MAFASNVRRKMAEALKVPRTPHSFEDIKLTLKAVKLGLPDETAVVGMEEMKKRYRGDFTLDDAMVYLEAYAYAYQGETSFREYLIAELSKEGKFDVDTC